MDSDFRKQLVKHIKGGQAFLNIDSVLSQMPFNMLGEVPENLPYSFYQIFQHLWFAQGDIIEYCLNENYKNKKWPQEYWTSKLKPDSPEEWSILKDMFFKDRELLCETVMNQDIDLFKKLNSGTTHTWFREIQLVIEHNAYHTGQLVLISRLLGCYNPEN